MHPCTPHHDRELSVGDKPPVWGHKRQLTPQFPPGSQPMLPLRGHHLHATNTSLGAKTDHADGRAGHGIGR